MSGSVLVLNAGSSTLKFGVFTEGVRTVGGVLPSGSGAVDDVLARVGPIAAAAHRVVHGGTSFTAPVTITPAVLAAIESLTPLAPLHQPQAVAAIRAVAAARPGVPQVACFDTAFHAGLPELEARFALPREHFDAGVRRYGFHGLSYESAAAALRRTDATAAAGRVAVAHLGNGASVCGMHAGCSMTTSMGMTPLDGTVMGTRCGRLDPGVLLHFLRNGFDAAQLEDLLDHRSGLLGLSGLSADVRDLEASPDPRAAFALEAFARSVAKEIAAAAVVLGGLDAIAFTGGIGEHSSRVRGRVCELLAWLGAEADPGANASTTSPFHTPNSSVKLFAVATDEEAIIAAHAARLLGAPA
jgi:acetate kinase